jgi:hypothetical protein
MGVEPFVCLKPDRREAGAFLAVLLLFPGLIPAAEDLSQLDKGHRILVQRGLQIQGQCFYQPGDLGLTSYTFAAQPYLDANFTAINWHYRPVNVTFAAAHPTFPWARWASAANALPQADFDVDGDVDQQDFGILQRCISGVHVSFSPGCEAADLNGDEFLTTDDVSVFGTCMKGPDQAPGCWWL